MHALDVSDFGIPQLGSYCIFTSKTAQLFRDPLLVLRRKFALWRTNAGFFRPLLTRESVSRVTVTLTMVVTPSPSLGRFRGMEPTRCLDSRPSLQSMQG